MNSVTSYTASRKTTQMRVSAVLCLATSAMVYCGRPSTRFPARAAPVGGLLCSEAASLINVPVHNAAAAVTATAPTVTERDARLHTCRLRPRVKAAARRAANRIFANPSSSTHNRTRSLTFQ